MLHAVDCLVLRVVAIIDSNTSMQKYKITYNTILLVDFISCFNN